MPQNRKSNAAQKNSRGKGSKQRKNAARQGAAEERALDSAGTSARNDIVGVVLAVVSVAMFISLVSPSSAVVTHAMERALTQSFGVGAFLCPFALFLFALTFFMDSDGPVNKRVAGGLFLIVLAVLAMFSVNVTGAEADPNLVLSAEVAPVAGGYVGGFIAWVLLALVGRLVGNAILVGLVITGVIVCGFSISDFVHHAHEGLDQACENHAERRAERMAQRQERQAEGDVPHWGLGKTMRANTVDDTAAEQPQVVTASDQTTYLGSRKTSVLTRGRRRQSKAERLAQQQGQRSIDQQPTDDAEASLQDGIATTRAPKKEHPDLDVDVATPAQTAAEAEKSLGETAKKAASQTKTTLLRRLGKLTGKSSSDDVTKASDDRQPELSSLDADPRVDSKLNGNAPADAVQAPDPATKSAVDAQAQTAHVDLPWEDPQESAKPQVAVPDFLRKAAESGPRAAQVKAAEEGGAKTRRNTRPAAQVRVAPAAASSRPGDSDDDYELPPMTMLSSNPNSGGTASTKAELDQTMQDLQGTLGEFGLRCTVVDYVSGPLVTTFRIEMGEGERVNKIKNLEDDIALTLAAEKVRIYAPIPGTSFVGVEIPNKTRQNVHLGDVLPYAKGGPLEVAIGRDSAGKPVVADIAKMPHMLVAGTTGSGKSVMINSMIMSLLMRTTPKQVRLIMIDPKRVEFTSYNGLPHLYVPVVTEPRQAASALQWAVSEMERRLKVFERAGARNIKVYNKMCVSGKLSQMDNPPEPMPYIVIIIDELSDLMMVAGKDVESSIVRIAQLARAAGIHLIIATQRPSANVVTGLIKSNIDTRAALKVSSGIDSRVILDETGAERLLGNGDMLFKDRGLTPRRVLGCYTSDNEIEEVVSFIRDQAEPDYHEEILTAVTPNTPGSSASDVADEDDPLVWEAAQIVVESQLGSTSGLQRRLKVGYARAGRIMDMLEAKGVVGPPDGSKPREVLLDKDQLEDLRIQEAKYREVL